MWHKVMILGRLGGDPEMKYTAEGTAVTNFSVAANRGGDKPPVWFRASCWEKQAEVVNTYLHKGDSVLIEGSLVSDESGSPRVYKKKDETYGASFEVYVDRIVFAGKAADHED